MAQIKFTVNLRGQKELIRAIKAEGQSLKNMDKTFRAMGNRLLRNSIQCFRKEQDPWGNKWKPLSDATIMSRAYKQTRSRRSRLKTTRAKNRSMVRALFGGKFPILRDTGDLFDSLASYSGKTWAKVGTPMKYGANHQHGIGVPQRAFLGITGEDVDFFWQRAGKDLGYTQRGRNNGNTSKKR